MKLLLIPLLISLTACSSSVTVNDKYEPGLTSVSIGTNIVRNAYYRVPKHAMAEHQNCVQFALREMAVGEECKWQAGNAVGIVKIGQITSNGCHYLLNTIYYRNKPKYFQENYCYNSAQKQWFKLS